MRGGLTWVALKLSRLFLMLGGVGIVIAIVVLITMVFGEDDFPTIVESRGSAYPVPPTFGR